MSGCHSSFWHGKFLPLFVLSYVAIKLIVKGMDILGVELVIVYGAPKSMSQLYQVKTSYRALS